MEISYFSITQVYVNFIKKVEFKEKEIVSTFLNYLKINWVEK